ncbi:molybdopterin molybdotransferase MoeA [Rothia uropygioeca]|uniref:molybdopterin molybdotransferase MoeA n=1 Tax=Kocuria sp. 257 TaxID=2021970 RepID=UPI0010120376|nr:molybdopterin molybdotransferase MoeA [Kocuria sp. 257]
MKRDWFDVREALHGLAGDIGRSVDRPEDVRLEDALGSTTSRAVASPIPVPHFDSSAMDGFAVAGPGPWRLTSDPVRSSGERNIHRRTGQIEAGEAWPVLTGSVLPEGTEGVVRAEHTETLGSTVRCLPGHPYIPDRDMRRRGEEMDRGTELVAEGTVLGPRHLALLAACGIDIVSAHRPMTVSMAFTGNEVIPSGVPQAGEVRDAFSAQFPHLLRGWGANVTERTRLHDDRGVIREWISWASGDLVILTGGSGSSPQDFVRQILEEMCTDLVATSIAVRPGHPTIVGRLPGDRIVLGLPGNPLAAHASLYSLAPVALAGFLGRDMPSLRPAVLGRDLPPSRRGSTSLVPCTLNGNVVRPCPGTQAHMLSGLAIADVLAVVPPDGVTEGQSVPCLLLD